MRLCNMGFMESHADSDTLYAFHAAIQCAAQKPAQWDCRPKNTDLPRKPCLSADNRWPGDGNPHSQHTATLVSYPSPNCMR